MWRSPAEPFGFQSHEHIAARHRRDKIVITEILRPMLGHDPQELDGDLPVPGEFLRHDLAECGKVDLLPFDIVHEIGEVGSKT
jgi:hypothetical protein